MVLVSQFNCGLRRELWNANETAMLPQVLIPLSHRQIQHVIAATVIQTAIRRYLCLKRYESTAVSKGTVAFVTATMLMFQIDTNVDPSCS